MATSVNASTLTGSVPTRHATAEALLDATERLLIDIGYAGLSSRQITEEAGQAHGSIRYHFGTLENLVTAVVERATERIITRQRAMYAADLPFRMKWRQAMEWFEEDLAAGYPKLLAELFSAAWNIPACRPGLQRMNEGMSGVLRQAAARAAREYGVDADDTVVTGVAGLIATSQLGMLFQRLAGIDVDHAETIALIERTIDQLEGRRAEP